MTARKRDIAEAGNGPETVREEGAPAGAPDPAHGSGPLGGVPAGEPEAPVAPVSSVESESVAPSAEAAGSAGSAGSAGAPGAAGTETSAGTSEAAAGTSEAQDAGAGAPGEDAPATEHERQLEHDIEQLTARAEKAEEYLELAQRTRADFENYRKRAAREAAVAQERGIAKLAKELLPAVDNLDRALEAAQSSVEPTADGAQADNGTATLISGIKLVHEDVINALARAGIERFSPEGEKFDPQQHEAIAQHPVEGEESGTVVQVYQRGYRLGEVVIRPARVVVAA